MVWRFYLAPAVRPGLGRRWCSAPHYDHSLEAGGARSWSVEMCKCCCVGSDLRLTGPQLCLVTRAEQQSQASVQCTAGVQGSAVYRAEYYIYNTPHSPDLNPTCFCWLHFTYTTIQRHLSSPDRQIKELSSTYRNIVVLERDTPLTITLD